MPKALRSFDARDAVVLGLRALRRAEASGRLAEDWAAVAAIAAALVRWRTLSGEAVAGIYRRVRGR